MASSFTMINYFRVFFLLSLTFGSFDVTTGRDLGHAEIKERHESLESRILDLEKLVQTLMTVSNKGIIKAHVICHLFIIFHK